MGPETQWRGQTDTTDRRMRWLVLASLLVHAPLTPLFALLGLFSWLAPPDDELDDAPAITAIPIDLLEGPTPGEPAPAPPPPPSEPEPAAAEPVVKPKPRPPRDAGVADAEPPDAGLPDAEGADGAAADADVADAQADAAPNDAGSGAGDGGIGSPVAMVTGDKNNVVDTNANVQLLIYTEKIRRHPLGPRIGKLLGSIYQWRDFFGPSGIDPIRDVDRVAVFGSQLRNSKDVVAILKLNISQARLHGAIDAIVRVDTEHGEWLDASVPAATAYADRAPRIFVFGAPGIVIVTPPSALQKVLGQARKIGVRPATGPEVAIAYLATPHRVRGLPIRIPDTILSVKLSVTPTADGGALLQMLAYDKTPELAAEHAEELERGLTAAASFDLGFIGQFLGLSGRPLVERIQLTSQGSEIHGEANVNASQLNEILGLAETFLVAPRRTAPTSTPARPTALPSAARPTTPLIPAPTPPVPTTTPPTTAPTTASP